MSEVIELSKMTSSLISFSVSFFRTIYYNKAMHALVLYQINVGIIGLFKSMCIISAVANAGVVIVFSRLECDEDALSIFVIQHV